MVDKEEILEAVGKIKEYCDNRCCDNCVFKEQGENPPSGDCCKLNNARNPSYYPVTIRIKKVYELEEK